MTPLATYRIAGGRFEVHDFYVCTAYDDGTACIGTPICDDEQRARALALGYPHGDEGVWRMHQEHELIHSVVSEAEGWPWSPTLWMAAHGLEPPRGIIPREERLVFLVQRALNVGRGLLEERREP